MTSRWKRRLQKLPLHTQAVVFAEIQRAELDGRKWTELRPFLDGEPLPGMDGNCQGDWPVNEKGKLINCPGTPTHIMYAVGGVAHGMDVVMCEPCSRKFENPEFDWDGPEKARF